MGKGNYRGDTHEIVMFFTTKDGGFDVDLTPFVKDTIETYDPDLNRTVLHWTSNVTFKEYSFQLKTTHFNINVLAEKIKNHLIDIKHPEFSYKIDKAFDVITNHYYDESFIKFAYNLVIIDTLYNPVTDEYKTYYNFDGRDIEYVHKGDPSKYKCGDFLKFVKNNALKKLYKFQSTNLNKTEEEFNSLFNQLRINVLCVGNTYYNVEDDNYLVEIKNSLNSYIYVTKDITCIHDIKDYLKKEFPEYIL